jgi:hypothetical protein
VGVLMGFGYTGYIGDPSVVVLFFDPKSVSAGS